MDNSIISFYECNIYKNCRSRISFKIRSAEAKKTLFVSSLWIGHRGGISESFSFVNFGFRVYVKTFKNLFDATNIFL